MFCPLEEECIEYLPDTVPYMTDFHNGSVVSHIPSFDCRSLEYLQGATSPLPANHAWFDVVSYSIFWLLVVAFILCPLAPLFLRSNRFSTATHIDFDGDAVQKHVPKTSQASQDKEKLTTFILGYQDSIQTQRDQNNALSTSNARLQLLVNNLRSSNNNLAAHNRTLERQNADMQRHHHARQHATTDLQQHIHDLQRRNADLERENINWRNSIRALRPPATDDTHSLERELTEAHDLLEEAQHVISTLRAEIADNAKEIARVRDSSRAQLAARDEEIRWRTVAIQQFRLDRLQRDEEKRLQDWSMAWLQRCVDDMALAPLWECPGFEEGGEIGGDLSGDAGFVLDGDQDGDEEEGGQDRDEVVESIEEEKPKDAQHRPSTY